MMQATAGGVTIGDVLRLALPLATTVSSGHDYRQRPVHWVAYLTDWHRAGQEVQPGDLLLVPASLPAPVPPEAFPVLVQALADAGIAGILSFGPLPPAATESARLCDLPVLVVPPATPVRDIHQGLVSLLLDRQQQTTERGMQLYRRLSETSREGLGLRAMTEIMSQLTGKIVVVQDKRLQIQAISRPMNSPIDVESLSKILCQRENLPPPLRNRKAVAQSGQSHWQQLLPLEGESTEIARLVSPIISGDRARGYVSVVGPAQELDLLDQLTVEHGAAACALEMAKAKAISEAKKELRGDFLDGLLEGRLTKGEIQLMESRLDHNTRQPHSILTFTWSGQGAPSLRRLETAINWVLTTHNRPVLVHLHGDDHVCVFHALNESELPEMGSAFDFARRLREHLEAEFPQANMVAGISGPATTISDWPPVYRQAVQAMRLGQRLKLPQLVDYNSLGVYQLLTQLEDIPAVQAFCEQIVGPLAAYDREHGSSLVQTMEAYFNHHGNVSQTAETLFIHRNTLLYRLERIQELTGQNLNQADMRLAMHLSLKLWQLRTSQEGPAR